VKINGIGYIYRNIARIMNHKYFLLSFLLISVTLLAQAPKGYDTGWIVLNGGEKIEGYIQYFAAGDTKIKFKPMDANKKPGSTQTYASNDLEEIAVYEQNQTKVFKKEWYGYMNMAGKMKKDDTPAWMAKVITAQGIEVYHYYQFLDLRTGNMNSGLWYYFTRIALKTPVMEFAFDVGYLNGLTNDPFKGQDKEFRDRIKLFLKMYCPALLENNKNKKYNRKKIEVFIEDYVSNCGSSE
jgi:hypothetical protein